MVTKPFTALVALLSLGLTVQGFPQLAPEAATAGHGPGHGGPGGPRPPPHGAVMPPNPPPPPTFLGAKLVNDRAHPFRAPKPSDLRGPCPGLNTLANHGVSPINETNDK